MTLSEPVGACLEIFAEAFRKGEFFSVKVVKLTGCKPGVAKDHLYYYRETICLRRRLMERKADMGSEEEQVPEDNV